MPGEACKAYFPYRVAVRTVGVGRRHGSIIQSQPFQNPGRMLLDARAAGR